MSATLQRDQVSQLARINPKKALEKARQISEPWFRAQALSWVARFTDGDPIVIATQAAKAASECDDDYKRSSVRAWEVAALAERRLLPQAGKALKEAVKLAKDVQPFSSRCEALLTLMQASVSISRDDAAAVFSDLKSACPEVEHWRCKRALRDAGKMLAGELAARVFYG